ncbi:MAG: MFS transporter [Novosphingobium sp.]|nr:MFS transporter [Novosphingobium sp.]MCP5404034.1 MFS transporter [Novosphingobium sp.]
MSQEQISAKQEWRQHWTLVLASMAGLSFAAIAGSSIGLFMEPLGREFGWSRTEITAGLTIYALIAVPLSPFAGALIDRWGARRMAIPGMFLTATAFACFSLANGSTVQWLGLWLFYSLMALSIRNTVWTAAVSSVFSKARGLALAITLTGAAITQIIAPVASQRLIDNFGWREAYLYLGTGWGLIVLALLIPFFFDARDTNRRRIARQEVPAQTAPELPGLSVAEAIRSTALYRIGLSTLIVVFFLTALNVHLVPVLNERGISRESAALMAALAGGFAIVGKLATGWMYDRWASGWINALSLSPPAAACLIFVTADNWLPLTLIAVCLLGYTNGAFMQVCTYLTGRYGGIRNFGKIFGVMASMIAVGVGIGPVFAGFIFDITGSYVLLLTCVIPAALFSGLLVATLGPYPVWTGEEQG